MLKERIITAVILAPLVLIGLFLLPFHGFQWFIALIVGLGAWEWANLSGVGGQLGRLSYALFIMLLLVPVSIFLGSQLPAVLLVLAAVFWCLALYWVCSYPRTASGWGSMSARLAMGVPVLVPTWLALVLLKAMPAADQLILLLMLIVWGADVGAYFAGKAWGRAKLASAVSPGKTMAGFYGGLAASLLIALACGLLWQLALGPLMALMVVSLLTALFSVLGDLLESMVKRHRGVKDSSRLLPGHGGVMDRIDSLTAAAPIFALGTTLYGLGSVVTA